VYAEERQQAIAGLVADRGRVAVTAVAERFGVTTETVRRDLAVLERAGQRAVVLADSSKLGREHLVRFAPLDDVDVVVTDSGADRTAVERIEDAGVEVVVA
jgi:DeoR family fructose operon transcriptional repressor